MNNHQTRIKVKSSPQQLRFYELEGRYRGFIAGIRSGKSYAGAIKSLMLALERPGYTGLIGGVTYPMINDVIIPVFMEITPHKLIRNYNKNTKILELKNDAKILFRPLENQRQIDRLRGLSLNWFWIDEGAYLPEYAWKVLQGRLSEGKDQVGLLTTTPKGYNWIYKYFIEKAHGDNYSAVTGVSSDSNPFIEKEYFDDIRQGYTGEYLKQEFFGQFIRFQGLIYTEFDPTTHIITLSKTKKMDFKEYIYGYDSGYRNPRVFVKIGITPNDKYVVLEEFYRKSALLSSSINTFKQIMGDDFGTVYADPSARGEIEEMSNQGLDIQGADNDVEAGIQTIKHMYESNQLYITEQCQSTINELNSYRWHEEKDKPVKEYDHSMDAIRYAIYTHKGGAIPFGTIDTR